MKLLQLIVLFTMAACSTAAAEEILRSPDEKIEVSLQTDGGKISYSVRLDGETIIAPSNLGLKSDASKPLAIEEISHSSGDTTWETIGGNQKKISDRYNEARLITQAPSAQTIVFRAYNDGIAFRYLIPETEKFSDEVYAYESSQVSFVSQTPKAWFPLTPVLVSDETDLNSWKAAQNGKKRVGRNVRYDSKPSVISTPFTLRLSEHCYLSVHEAAVVHSDVADLRLQGNTLTYDSNIKTAGGQATPWRTINISDRAGGLIESSLILNLNEPCEIEDTSWIKPGVTMWDWRNHGALADDGFEYGLNTESYIRYIDFAAEFGVAYVLIDAEWYGPERDKASDPKTHLPEIDIPKICAYAKNKGVGMWLYVNSKALNGGFDIDATFEQYRDWGVVGIKQGFAGGSNRSAIERDLEIVKKCAQYKLMHIRHESPKPTGYNRTYPNTLSYEYVNSMLDSATRPSATPSRVINGLFVFGVTGPVDRSCGMFDLDSYISRDKCHRQIPSTVVSQVAQCLLYPSGLLTLPDIPDAYRRKADLFEFIGQLPMKWDQTKVLEAEIGHHITMARQSGDQWFVGALADESGREISVILNFLKEGITYDVTLYEDAPDANYQYAGPMNKKEARATKQELAPAKTQRERYQVKQITAKKGRAIAVTIAPGGGHCMWIRPQAASNEAIGK